MSTLWQKFPGITEIEKKVLIYPVAVKFSAPLIGGKFAFVNQRVFAFVGNEAELFVLDGVQLSANIDQLTFSNSLDASVNNGLFGLDIIGAGNDHAVTLAPFKFSAFNQGAEFAANWRVTATKDRQEDFLFQISGSLIQTPEIIALGRNSVDIILTANVLRVKQDLYKGLK